MDLTNRRGTLLNGLHYGVKKFPQFFDIYSYIINDENSYVAQSSDDFSNISYATKPEYKLNNNKRTKTTLGRYIKRKCTDLLIKNTINDKQLEEFVAVVLSHFPELMDFTILKGRDIETAYYNGLGDTSCMTGCCAEFTRVYTDNPDKVGLLTLKNYSRALIWKTDEGRTLIDRIYPNSGQHIALYEKYAKDNKFGIREHHGIPYEDVRFKFKNKTRKSPYYITLKLSDSGQYPYMDSFKYGVKSNKVILSNQHFGNSVRLDRTDGNFGLVYICNSCGYIIDVSDGNNYLYVDNLIYCKNCTGYCYECGDTVLLVNSLPVGNKTYCHICYNDRYYTCICGKAILKTTAKHLYKRKYYCWNCFRSKKFVTPEFIPATVTIPF